MTGSGSRRPASLDWSHIDAPDPYWLNRIIWYSLHKGASPYPGRPGEEPGQVVDLDRGLPERRTRRQLPERRVLQFDA